MSAPQQLDAAAVAGAYQQSTTAMRTWIENYVRALWKSLGTYGNRQMRDFSNEIVPLVESAMDQMSTSTSAYLNMLNPAGVVKPVTVRPPTVQSVRGMDGRIVYERPFHLTWRQLGEGKRAAAPPDGWVQSAIDAGENRAVLTALTDVQRAKVVTSQQVLQRDVKAVGYRRQTEGAYTCGLCLVAATQRYHRAELMPIHPGCDCSVRTIYGDEDPGQLIDDAALQNVHDIIEKTFGTSSSEARAIPGQLLNGEPVNYRDVLIAHEHGELGRVLAVRGRPFSTLSDMERST